MEEMSDDPSNAVELWRDDEGVLIAGSPEDVNALVARLTALGGEQLARSPVEPADALAVFLTGYADGATSGQYIRFTDESMALLERHGAVPNGNGGFHSLVRDDGGIVGNLEWVASGAGPERALAFQSAALGLALRTAVKSVEAAVSRVEDKVDQVVALMRAERLGNVLGDRRTLDRLVSHLDAGDPLSATDWSSVASLGPAITRDLERIRAHLRGQIEEVDGSWRPRERASEADHLLAKGMLTETLGVLLLAEHNHSQWQRLRIQRIADAEPENLEAAVRQAKAAMQEHLAADKEFLSLFASAQDQLFEPRDLDGLAVIQTRRLSKAEVELSDLTRWFADQRLLEFDGVDLRDRPGLRDSVSGVIDAGRSRIPDVPRPRRRSTAEAEPLAIDADEDHRYQWAIDGPPLGTWRTFEGTFSNVMATELTFRSDGTGTVLRSSAIGGGEETPLRWQQPEPGQLWIGLVFEDGEAPDPAEDGDLFRYTASHAVSDAGSSPVLINHGDEPDGWIPAGGFWTLDAPVSLVRLV